MTLEQIEQLKRERAAALNALADIADFTIDYKVKQLAEKTLQQCKK